MSRPPDNTGAPPPARPTRTQELAARYVSDLDSPSSAEVRGLVHALEVHEMELHAQNDQLRATQRDLELSRNRYLGLYESAPEGYITLDAGARIVEANPAAALLLGADRPELIGAPLAAYVAPADAPALMSHLARCRSSGDKTITQLPLAAGQRSSLFVQLSTRWFAAQDDAEACWRIVIADLSEHRREEQAVKAERDRLANVLDSMEDPAYLADEHFVVQYANPALVREFGPVVGRKCFECLAGRTDACESCEDMDIFRGQRVRSQWQCERTGKTYDAVGTPLRNVDGTFWRLQVLRDVTERKAAEAILKARLRLSEAAQQAGGDEIMQAALDEAEALTGSSIGFFHLVNEDQKSLTLQAWSTNTLKSMCHAQGKGSHYAIDQAGVWVECFYARKPVIHNDYAGLPNKKGMPQGHAPVVRELAVPIIRAGRVVGIMGVGNKASDYTSADAMILEALASPVLDLVARKNMEAALHRTQGRYHALFENMMDGFAHCRMVFDDKGLPADFVYIDVNSAFQALTGLADVVGKTVSEVIPGIKQSNPELLEIYGRVARTGKSERFEIGIAPLKKWFAVSVYSPQPEHFVAVFEDITSRKAAEEGLKIALAELSRSNSDLQQFASVASHDLQAPLRTVTGFLGLLKDRYSAQLDDKGREFITFATDGAQRMGQLIRDLLAFARVGSRGGEFRTMELGKVLQRALAERKDAIADSGAVITQDALPIVVADEGQMAQLLSNLIGNAIKYQAKDHRPRIHVGAKRGEGHWLISVRDNGIGIDPKHADCVFDLFRRLHGQGEYEGTGIGLAICKRILERHGGRIWVESQPGQGSTFLFTLPDRA